MNNSFDVHSKVPAVNSSDQNICSITQISLHFTNGQDCADREGFSVISFAKTLPTSLS